MTGKRRRKHKKLGRFTVFGVVVLAIVLCGTFLYKTSDLKAQSKEYGRQLESLQEQKKELEEENRKLDEFEDYVKTDEYTEEIARERLGLVYSDEILFVPEEKK